MPRFYANVLLARLKLVAKPSFFAAFALLAALAVAPGFIFNRTEGALARIGVFLPVNSTNCAVAQRTVSSLERYGSGLFETVICEDEEQMKLDVVSRRLDCAYAFGEKTEELGFDKSIALYSSPYSTADKFSSLLVAAAYLENFAGLLGSETLRPHAPEATGLSEEIQKIADGYLEGGALMEMILLESGGTFDAPETAPYGRMFRGLVGLFGWLLALFLAYGFAEDASVASAKRLKSSGRGLGAFVFSGAAVAFLLTSAYMGFASFIGDLLFPGAAPFDAYGASVLLTYAFALACLATLLSRLLRASAYPALITFAFVSSALLCGAFFDIREVFAQAGFARLIAPPHYYLDAMQDASGKKITAMLAAGTVFAILAGMPFAFSRKR